MSSKPRRKNSKLMVAARFIMMAVNDEISFANPDNETAADIRKATKMIEGNFVCRKTKTGTLIVERTK